MGDHSGAISIFTEELRGPEGPVLLPDASWVVVEFAANPGCVTWISSDGSEKRVLADTGRPNGLAVDGSGAIWVAESHPSPAVLRMNLDGDVEVVATSSSEGPMLLPNDLCFGPNGHLFVTDSGVLFGEFAPDGKPRPDYQDLTYDGAVLDLDPQEGTARQIDSALGMMNGIAFGPDGLLYANETFTGDVYSYRPMDDGSYGDRQTVANVLDPDLPAGYGPGGFRGPDGMAFGDDGLMYVSVFGQQEVTVVGTDGVIHNRLRTRGKFPTNVAFGPPGSHLLYVTEVEYGAMEAHRVDCDGLPLYT